MTIQERLIQEGYKLDNSIEDYTKLFSNQQWFGENWESQRDFHYSESLKEITPEPTEEVPNPVPYVRGVQYFIDIIVNGNYYTV